MRSSTAKIFMASLAFSQQAGHSLQQASFSQQPLAYGHSEQSPGGSLHTKRRPGVASKAKTRQMARSTSGQPSASGQTRQWAGQTGGASTGSTSVGIVGIVNSSASLGPCT